MGERLLCKQEVIGSIPFTSTTGAAAAAPRRQAQRGCAESPAVTRLRRAAGLAPAGPRAGRGRETLGRGKKFRAPYGGAGVLIER